jgi:hypothetical protein
MRGTRSRPRTGSLSATLSGSPWATLDNDLWTILILWLAGASAMAGLLNLVPRYLPRFGMAPAWAARARPLVLVLFVINVVVTLVFRASVEAQSGAYATGVLALILSAALAVTLALWREERRPASVYFGAMTLVFAYTLVDNCVERPDGVIIGSAFILLVLMVSTVSRSVRATGSGCPRPTSSIRRRRNSARRWWTSRCTWSP